MTDSRSPGLDSSLVSRGRQSEKVAGKSLNIHFPLSFLEASLQRGNVEIWEGEVPRGSLEMPFPLGVRGKEADGGVLQLLPKLASFVPLLSFHLCSFSSLPQTPPVVYGWCQCISQL